MKREHNAVELWAKEVESCEKREMTPKEVIYYLQYSFAESNGLSDDTEKEIKELLEKVKEVWPVSYISVLSMFWVTR